MIFTKRQPSFLTPLTPSRGQPRHCFPMPLVCAFAADGKTFNFLLARTASASSSKTSTVVFQSIQASVILIPFFKASGPSGGTFWAPSWMLDSIITPVMAVSPAEICWAIVVATRGWLRWFFCELPFGLLDFAPFLFGKRRNGRILADHVSSLSS